MEGLAQYFRDIGYDHIANIFEQLTEDEVDQLRSMFEMQEDVVIFVPREWNRALANANRVDLISGWMTTASELTDGMAGGGEVEMFNSAIVGVIPDHIGNVDIVELVSRFRLQNGELLIYGTDGVLDTNAEDEANATTDGFAAYLAEHGQIALASVIRNLSGFDKEDLERLIRSDRAIAMFVPPNDDVEEQARSHQDHLNLISGWMTTVTNLRVATDGDQRLTMLNRTRVNIAGDDGAHLESFNGETSLRDLNETFSMGDIEIYVTIVGAPIEQGIAAFPQYLRDHGFGFVADLIQSLGVQDRAEFDNLIAGPGDVIMFIPGDNQLNLDERRELRGFHTFTLLSNWIALTQVYRTALERRSEVEMLSGSTFSVTEERIGGLLLTGRVLANQALLEYRIGDHTVTIEQVAGALEPHDEDDFPPPDGPADLGLAIIENFARYLIQHDQITLAEIIRDLPDGEKIQLEGLMSLDNATQFFIPPDDVLRAAFHNHPDKFNLIRGWMVTMDVLHDAIDGDKAITMLDGSRFIVVGDSADDLQSVDGKRVISTLDPIFYMGVNEIFISIVDGVLLRDPNAAPLDPNAITSAAQADITFRELMNRAMDLAIIEQRNYGETELWHELDKIYGDIRRVMGVSRETSRFVALVDAINQRLQKVQERQHALGRRCLNTTDFGDGSKVFEARDVLGGTDLVPEDQFIRLRNGVCWEMDSLMNFIVLQRGQNTIIKSDDGLPWPPFRAYPGVRNIWQDEAELQRILNHPAALASNFRSEFNAILMANRAEEARVVSVRTLDMLERTGRLLASEGPIFEAELNKVLDEHQREVWERANHDPDQIQDKEDQKHICVSIVTTLKSNALADWAVYWEGLSEAEQDFIKKQDPSLVPDLKRCSEGDLCVYLTTSTLFRTRNQIAALKGLPIISRITLGLDPAKVCQGISERIMTGREMREQTEREEIQRRFAGGNADGVIDQESAGFQHLLIDLQDGLEDVDGQLLDPNMDPNEFADLLLRGRVAMLTENGPHEMTRAMLREWGMLREDAELDRYVLDPWAPQLREVLFPQLLERRLADPQGLVTLNPNMSDVEFHQRLLNEQVSDEEGLITRERLLQRRVIHIRVDRNSEQWEELVTDLAAGQLTDQDGVEVNPNLGNDNLELTLLRRELSTADGVGINPDTFPRVGNEVPRPIPRERAPVVRFQDLDQNNADLIELHELLREGSLHPDLDSQMPLNDFDNLLIDRRVRLPNGVVVDPMRYVRQFDPRNNPRVADLLFRIGRLLGLRFDQDLDEMTHRLIAIQVEPRLTPQIEAQLATFERRLDEIEMALEGPQIALPRSPIRSGPVSPVQSPRGSPMTPPRGSPMTPPRGRSRSPPRGSPRSPPRGRNRSPMSPQRGRNRSPN